MRHGRCVFIGKKMHYNDVIKLACVLIHIYIYTIRVVLYMTTVLLKSFITLDPFHPLYLSLTRSRFLSHTRTQTCTLDNRLYTHHFFFFLYNINITEQVPTATDNAVDGPDGLFALLNKYYYIVPNRVLYDCYYLCLLQSPLIIVKYVVYCVCVIYVYNTRSLVPTIKIGKPNTYQREQVNRVLKPQR